MQLVPSFEDLARRPVGSALLGRSFVAWCATPRLSGTVHFGRRDSADAALLMRLYGLVRHRSLRPPLCRVVDGRALTGIDDDAWDAMVGALSSQTESLRPAFERQAIIVAPGVGGARTAALLPALGPGDACRVFVDADDAYRFADPIDGPLAKAGVDELVATISSIRIVEARARAWVAGNLRAADVTACAASLGMSTRTLQRKLGDLGSSYRALVAAERVAAARAQLEDGDAKIEAVARAVGCSSASQLGVLLRRAGGARPSALRAAHRRTASGSDEPLGVQGERRRPRPKDRENQSLQLCPLPSGPREPQSEGPRDKLLLLRPVVALLRAGLVDEARAVAEG